MHPPKRSAASPRDKLLTELGEAIDKATQLAWRLGFGEGGSTDARQLFNRLGALRAELETLRCNSRPIA